MAGRYVQVSSGWLVDKDTYKLIPGYKRESTCTIDVPDFMWTSGTGYNMTIRRGDDVEEHIRSYSMDLNNLLVTFHPTYRGFEIHIKDETYINVGYFFRYMTQKMGGQAYDEVVGVDFDVAINRVRKDFRAMPLERVPAFEYIIGLGTVTEDVQSRSKFCYGISDSQWRIRLRGRELNGKSYALLCGPCAVLLSDNFEFDSLMLLSGVSSKALDVAKVAYSVNPYVIKAATLIG